MSDVTTISWPTYRRSGGIFYYPSIHPSKDLQPPRAVEPIMPWHTFVLRSYVHRSSKLPILTIMLSQTPFSKPNSHFPRLFMSQPSLFGASFTSKIVLCSSPLMRSSLIILLSTRASSPSNFSIGFGVKASRTKWLSQCGQYSSDSSNSWASFRKVFLHFLQAKVCGLY
jgi:hypothetical protein